MAAWDDESLGAFGSGAHVPTDTWFPVDTTTGQWGTPTPTLARAAGIPDLIPTRTMAPVPTMGGVGGLPDQAPLSIGQVAGGFAPPMTTPRSMQRVQRLDEMGALAPKPSAWEGIARAIGMASPQGRAILQASDQQQQQQLQNRLTMRRQMLQEDQEARAATQEGYRTLVAISQIKNKALRNLQFDRFAAQAAEAGQALPADFIETYKKSTLAEGEGIAQAYGPLLEKAGFSKEQTTRILESGDLDTIKGLLEGGLKVRKQSLEEQESADLTTGLQTLGGASGVPAPAAPGPSLTGPAQAPRGYADGGAQPIVGAEKLTPSFTAKAQDVAGRLGMNPQDLLRIISFETAGTFDPATTNRAGSGATGLLQFLPDTAKALGTTTEALAKMTPEQQLDYVEKYLTPYKGKLGNIKDAYLAVLKPSALGGKATDPLFTQKGDPLAYRQNAGLDKSGKGVVTVGDAVDAVLRTTSGGPAPATTGGPATGAVSRDQVAGPGAPSQDPARLAQLNQQIAAMDQFLQANIGRGSERTRAAVTQVERLRDNLVQERTQLTEPTRASVRARAEAEVKADVEERVKGRQTAAEVLGERVTTFFDKDTGEQESPGQSMDEMRKRLSGKKVAVLSTDQAKQLSVLKQLEPVLDGYKRLVEYAYGPKGPLKDFSRQPFETVTAMWDQAGQKDPQLQAMRRSLEGQLQSVVRGLGARGDLNAQELDAAKQMLANFDASLGLGISAGAGIGRGGVGPMVGIKPSISVPDTPQTGMRVANELFDLVNKRIGSLLGNPGYKKNALLEVPETPPPNPDDPAYGFGYTPKAVMEAKQQRARQPTAPAQAPTAPAAGAPAPPAAPVPAPPSSGQRALKAMSPAQLRQLPDALARTVIANPGMEQSLSPAQKVALADRLERWEREQARR